jgi:putative transposase
MSSRWAPNPDIRPGRSVICSLHHRLDPQRRDVLNGEMLDACERIMRGLCAEMGAELREFNGDNDHVRLLVRYPPKLPVSTLVNRLKGVSAHYLRKKFTGRVSQHLIHGHL